MVAGVKCKEYKVDMVVEGRKINKVFLEALTFYRVHNETIRY